MAFLTTRWSLVNRAADGADRDAMEELLTLYWPAVYWYFRGATGGDRHRAEDLTQGLFAQLIERTSLSQVDPGRGRFRTWLLSCAMHHLSNECAAANAQKRGGGLGVPLPLDFDGEEGRMRDELVDPGEGPEQAFARRWVSSLVDRVLEALEEEFMRRGRGPVFCAARAFLDPSCDARPMRDAARDSGTTEGAFKVAVHRLRERFHERLREEIEDTLDDRGELDDELAHLRGLLAKG